MCGQMWTAAKAAKCTATVTIHPLYRLKCQCNHAVWGSVHNYKISTTPWGHIQRVLNGWTDVKALVMALGCSKDLEYIQSFNKRNTTVSVSSTYKWKIGGSNKLQTVNICKLHLICEHQLMTLSAPEGSCVPRLHSLWIAASRLRHASQWLTAIGWTLRNWIYSSV